jgi:hypothetical protein
MRLDTSKTYDLAEGTYTLMGRFLASAFRMLEAKMGRGALLWMLGVPLPIVLLLLLFWR